MLHPRLCIITAACWSQVQFRLRVRGWCKLVLNAKQTVSLIALCTADANFYTHATLLLCNIKTTLAPRKSTYDTRGGVVWGRDRVGKEGEWFDQKDRCTVSIPARLPVCSHVLLFLMFSTLNTNTCSYWSQQSRPPAAETLSHSVPLHLVRLRDYKFREKSD